MKYGLALSQPLIEVVSFCSENPVSAVQIFPPDLSLYDETFLDSFKEAMSLLGVDVVVHASLSMNLISNKFSTKSYSKRILKENIASALRIGAKKVVIHPGSLYPGDKVKALADTLNSFIFPQNLEILVETMCGSGSQAMTAPEDFAELFNLVKSQQVKCCLDTAHSFGAGFYPYVWAEKMYTLGILSKLSVVHFNNTSSELASNKEKHQILRKGNIAKKDFVSFLSFLMQCMDIKSLTLIEELPKCSFLKGELKVFEEILKTACVI